MACVTVTHFPGHGKSLERLGPPARRGHAQRQCYQGCPVAGTLPSKGYPVRSVRQPSRKQPRPIHDRAQPQVAQRPHPGPLKVEVPAGNRISSYNAARSACPAVELKPAGPCAEAGKTYPYGGSPHPPPPLLQRSPKPAFLAFFRTMASCCGRLREPSRSLSCAGMAARTSSGWEPGYLARSKRLTVESRAPRGRLVERPPTVRPGLRSLILSGDCGTSTSMQGRPPIGPIQGR